MNKVFLGVAASLFFSHFPVSAAPLPAGDVAAAPDPRDSIILESKMVHATSGAVGIVRLRVWITNKDTLANVSLVLEEKSLSDNAYLTVARPRTFNGTVDRLTTTLGNYPIAAYIKYNDLSPDSFTLAGFFDPVDIPNTAEPPNPVRKPLWDIKFDSARTNASGGNVQFDSTRIMNVSSEFADAYGHDIPVNFVKGLVTIYRHFPDLPLNLPIDGALLLSRRPIFMWQSPRDSLLAKIKASYAVLVASDSSFAPAFRSELLADTVWKIPDTLLMRHQYFWKVAAIPDTGDTIFSETWRFTIVNPSLTLWRPSQHQILGIRQPSFAWQKLADSSTGDTFFYRVLIAIDTIFTSADSSPALADTLWKTDHKLKTNQNYFWKILATGGNQDTAYSAKGAFSVVDPPFALLRPSQNQVLRIRQPSFSWQKVSDSSTGDTFSYRVLVSRNASFAFPDTSPVLADTVWKAGHKLDTAQNYYWKVLALTAGGDTVASGSGNFSILNPPLALWRPLPNQVLRIRQPSFSWQKVSDSSTGDTFTYRMSISTAANFTPADSSPVLADTVWKPAQALGLFQTYYWKIRAADASGDTLFSAGSGKFFVTPPVLGLLNPNNGSRVLMKQPILNWVRLRDTSMVNSFTYQVALATRSDFSDAVVSPVLSDTFWSPGSPLNVGTTYYWYVAGFYTAAGDTVWSNGPYSFSISPTRIVVPDDRPTIQDGIDAALNGDTVWVKPGTYTQNIQFKGKRIKVISEGGPAQTAIANMNEGLPLVTFSGNEDSAAVLRGFTVSGARQVSSGGAIKIVRASPRIENNYILRNSGDAGALWIEGGAPKLRRILVAQNSGRSAIRLLSGATGEITNCTVSDNLGDGVLLDSGLVDSSRAVHLTNCILSFNTGCGIRSVVASNFSAVTTYNDFYGNTAGSYSGILPLQGNLSVDPQFVDRASLDYHLLNTSPCRDAGDPASPVPLGGGLRVDMGAFEVTVPIQRGDLDGNGVLSLPDAIYEIDCAFLGNGTCAMELTDTDCSGSVTPSDVVWLLNAVFKSLSLPC